MGRRHRKHGRVLNGILLLDKSTGISSNDALQQVKRIFQAQKAGHTGSLDMGASGLLPLCFGEATKLSGFLLEADKRYHTVCRLGIKTATGDAEGKVLETKPVPSLSTEQIEKVLSGFTGTIEQIPPMHSALKINGQRLYKLAYQGIEIERKPREVTIHSIERLSHTDNELELEIHCSKGTYIRTLAEDIGAELGCGGHVQTLRRLGAGPFDLADAITMDQINEIAGGGLPALDELLAPLDSALLDWPDVRLPGDSAYYLRMGQPVLVPHAPTDGLVRLYTASDEVFIGVGKVLGDGRIAPKRLISASNS